MALPSQSLDETRRHRLYLEGAVDPEDPEATPASLAREYDGTETFSAVLWTGDARAAVATLDAEWDSTLPGNPASLDSPAVLLTIAADTIGELTPGRYRVHVLLNPGTDDTLVFSDLIELTAAPGSDGALSTYCTLDDMLRVYPPLGQLMADDPSEQTDYAEQRHEARLWLERAVVARGRRIQLDQARRHPLNLLWLGGAAGGGLGYDYGPAHGPSIRQESTVASAESTLRGWLDADKLMTSDASADGGRARRLCVLYALAMVLEAQVDDKGESPYQKLAARYLSRARTELSGWTARLDVDGDGSLVYELRPGGGGGVGM